MPFNNISQLLLASIRSLCYSRRFSYLVLLTLTLPLATVLIALHLFYQLLFAPLPYPQAEQLYLVRGQQLKGSEVLYANLMTAAGTAELYQQQFAWSQRVATHAKTQTQVQQPPTGIIQAALLAYGTDVARDHPASPQVAVAYISPEYFSLLQAPFLTGQSLATQPSAVGGAKPHPMIDASAPAGPEAVISYQLWQRLFAGDKQILQQHVQIGTQRFKVVGVLAKDFVEPAILHPGQQTDIWLPWAFNPTYQQYRHWWGALAPDHHLLVKLAPAVQADLLAAQLSDLLNAEYRSQVRQSPYAAHFVEASISISMQPLLEVLQHNTKGFSQFLLIGCGLLLFIALLNVSQLLLARSDSQQPQQAVRLALGANPAELADRQFCEITLLLLVATGLAGLLLSLSLPIMQQAAAGYLARLPELTVRPWLVLSPLGLLPPLYLLNQLQAKRRNYQWLQQQLQRSGKGSAAQQHRQATSLLAAHGFFSSVLLLLALLLAQSAWQRLLPVTGLQLTNVQQLQLSYVAVDGKPASTADLIAIRDLLANQLRTTSQHPTAALAYSPVLDFQALSVQDSLSWPQTTARQAVVRVESTYSDHQLPALLGLQQLSGSWPAADALLNKTPLELVINLSAARQLLAIQNSVGVSPQDGPLPASDIAIARSLTGKQLLFNGDTAAYIAAVVADLQLPSLQPAQADDVPRAWISNLYHFLPAVYLRYPQPAISLSPETLNQLLASVNPAFKVQRLTWLADAWHRSQRLARLTLALSLLLSAIAVLLVVGGISAVLSYQLLLQQYQLSVHRALGAPPAQLLYLLLRRYLLPVGVGATVGMITMYLSIRQQWLAELLGNHLNQTLSDRWFQHHCLSVGVVLLIVCFLLLVRQNQQLHQLPVQRLLR